MTPQEAAVKRAEYWLGYLEKRTADERYLWDKTANAGSNNFTCFALELSKTKILNSNKQGMPWCAVFYISLFNETWGEAKTRAALYLPEYSSAAGCMGAVAYYRAKGKYQSTPAIGAQIFFSDSDGDPCHTGIVVGYDSTYVYTIEGNTSSSSSETVISNGGGVFKRTYRRSYSRIHGYGVPDWSVLGGVEPEKKTVMIYKPMKTYQNGSTPEPVYRDSDFTDQTGMLNAGERAWCSGWYGYKGGSKSYAVCYLLDGYSDRYAVGYVRYDGGVKDD